MTGVLSGRSSPWELWPSAAVAEALCRAGPEAPPSSEAAHCEPPGAQTRNSREPGWGGGCPLSNGEQRHQTGIWRQCQEVREEHSKQLFTGGRTI